MNELEKVDVVKARTGVSYRAAREALATSDGDVLEALIHLEEGSPADPGEVIRARGAELLDHIRRLIHEGNVRRVVVSRGGQVLLDIPVTAGAAGAVLLPYLTAAGTLAAVLTECSISVHRRETPGEEDSAEES